MGQAGLVQSLDGRAYGLEVVAVAGLVAERPHEDTGMVAEPAYLVGGTLYHRIAEHLDRRQLLMGVTLHVGLCQYIQAVFVA